MNSWRLNRESRLHSSLCFNIWKNLEIQSTVDRWLNHLSDSLPNELITRQARLWPCELLEFRAAALELRLWWGKSVSLVCVVTSVFLCDSFERSSLHKMKLFWCSNFLVYLFFIVSPFFAYHISFLPILVSFLCKRHMLHAERERELFLAKTIFSIASWLRARRTDNGHKQFVARRKMLIFFSFSFPENCHIVEITHCESRSFRNDFPSHLHSSVVFLFQRHRSVYNTWSFFAMRCSDSESVCLRQNHATSAVNLSMLCVNMIDSDVNSMWLRCVRDKLTSILVEIIIWHCLLFTLTTFLLTHLLYR